jgi:hypothetical protein
MTRAAPVAALVAMAAVLWPTPFALSDHRVFVEAGRLVLSGRTPYDNATWIEVARAVGSPFIAMLAETTGVWPHPPWVAYAFVPFAFLPGDLGVWALHAVLLAAGIVGAVLLVERGQWATPAARALALVVAITFEPLVIGIRWGQLAPLLLLGFALLVRGLDRRAVLPIVAGALLLALKPHVVVLLAVVGAVMVARRVPRAAVTAAATLAIVCGIPALVDRGWLGAAAQGYGARIDGLGTYATTYALAIDVAGAAWPIVAAICIAIALAACAYAVRRSADADILWPLAAAATLSLVLVPYEWPTDHVLLLAVGLLALRAADQAPRGVRAAHLGLVVLVLTATPWVLFILSAPRQTQALEALVPLLAALVLAQSARISAGGAPTRTSRPPRAGSPQPS